MRRVSTQPVWPALVRTRLQSSVGIDFCPASSAGGFSVGFSAPTGGRDSSSQLAGGPGGLGRGGGGILGAVEAFRGWTLGFFGARGTIGGRGADTRGTTT